MVSDMKNLKICLWSQKIRQKKNTKQSGDDRMEELWRRWNQTWENGVFLRRNVAFLLELCRKKKILKMNMYQVETSGETSDTGFMGDAP